MKLSAYKSAKKKKKSEKRYFPLPIKEKLVCGGITQISNA